MPKTVYTIRMEDDTWQALRKSATQNGTSANAVLRSLAEAYVSGTLSDAGTYNIPQALVDRAQKDEVTPKEILDALVALYLQGGIKLKKKIVATL